MSTDILIFLLEDGDVVIDVVFFLVLLIFECTVMCLV